MNCIDTAYASLKVLGQDITRRVLRFFIRHWPFCVSLLLCHMWWNLPGLLPSVFAYCKIENWMWWWRPGNEATKGVCFGLVSFVWPHFQALHIHRLQYKITASYKRTGPGNEAIIHAPATLVGTNMCSTCEDSLFLPLSNFTKFVSGSSKIHS